MSILTRDTRERQNKTIRKKKRGVLFKGVLLDRGELGTVKGTGIRRGTSHSTTRRQNVSRQFYDVKKRAQSTRPSKGIRTSHLKGSTVVSSPCLQSIPQPIFPHPYHHSKPLCHPYRYGRVTKTVGRSGQNEKDLTSVGKKVPLSLGMSLFILPPLVSPRQPYFLVFVVRDDGDVRDFRVPRSTVFLKEFAKEREQKEIRIPRVK